MLELDDGVAVADLDVGWDDDADGGVAEDGADACFYHGVGDLLRGRGWDG